MAKIDNRERNKVVSPAFDESNIYERGELGQISIPELVDNEVAIRQLINQYNIKERLVKNLQEKANGLEAELRFQKTSPFYAAISCVVDVVGTISVGLGSNLLVNNKELAIWMIALGAILVLVANIQTVCHRWVNGWLNRKE